MNTRVAIKERLEKLLGKGSNFEVELDALYARLSELESVQSLRNSAGWEKIVKELYREVKNLERDIILKSSDPVKNERELLFARANHKAIVKLFSIVEGFHEDYMKLLSDIDKLVAKYEDIAQSGIPII